MLIKNVKFYCFFAFTFMSLFLKVSVAQEFADPLNCHNFNVADIELTGDATIQGETITLTKAQDNKSGMVWGKNRLDLNFNFKITSRIKLGSRDAGADGIAFVIKPPDASAGASGGGIGYQGISPSFAVEFDTYYNSHDPYKNDHIALVKNGLADNLSAHNEFAPAYDVGQLEDGNWHDALFIWQAATNIFTVLLDGVTIFNTSVDLIHSVFENSRYAYWGFTSATGGENNLHQVEISEYCVSYYGNEAPEISELQNITTCETSPNAKAEFTITDDASDPDKFQIIVTSSKQELLKNSSIDISSSGNENEIDLSPEIGVIGESTITVAVMDGEGAISEKSFTLTVEDCDGDGDGVSDRNDAFPTNEDEWSDNDGDGTGDNADTDDDNDGVSDTDEATAGTNPNVADTDGDGVNDKEDVFPTNPDESADNDADGTGDNADTDDDNDGVLDAVETDQGTNPNVADTDGDGVNDKEDVFPTNPDETADNDADGTGDNADTDDDNDGVADAVETDQGTNPNVADTDGDGVNDKDDAFPTDKTEQMDSDEDGIGDNSDEDEQVGSWTELKPGDDTKVNIYPSIGNGIVHVNVSNTNHFKVQVYDLSGKKVMIEENLLESTLINLSGMPSGCYIIQIEQDAKSIKLQKVIKR